MVANGQVQVRDLVMGRGTDWEIVDFNPWTRSVRADQTGPRAWNHGSWSGAEWLESPTISWHICQSALPDPVTCTNGDYDAWIARQEQLTAAFAPIGDGVEEIELRFRFGSQEYIMFGRPRLVDPDNRWLSWARGGGVVVTVAFVALDPRRYSADLMTVTTGLPQYSDGLTVPLYVPAYVHGSKISGEIIATNNGLAPAPVNIRIDGPAVNPTISVSGPDGSVQTLSLSFTISAGQFVLIDTGSHSVLLNGTESRRSQVSGTFPVLKPGTSRIFFNADKFNEDALLTVSWRHAW